MFLKDVGFFLLVIAVVILMLFFGDRNSTTAQSYEEYKTKQLMERSVKAEERQADALEAISSYLQAIKQTRCHRN